MVKWTIFLGTALLSGFAVPVGRSTAEPESKGADAHATVRRLGRGVNLGNALDAPNEGDWGFRIDKEYFSIIKQAGFDHVRLPVRWSNHAAKEAPYLIDATFSKRVDWAVGAALEQGLAVVLNVHHYGEMDQDPAGNKARFLALWKQIAEHYQDRPAELVFELLNEPHGKLTDDVWNALLADALGVIRKTNPGRAVIVGPTQWNGLQKLPALRLPKDDRRLIATFHYYLPFHFTHQGAEWSEGSAKWLGTKWTGTADEKKAVTEAFDKAVKWAKAEDRPLYLGEFGAYSKADMESRARWTRYLRDQAEARGMAWAYWEFGSGFGVYDPAMKAWREPLREALVGPDRPTPRP